MSGQIKRAVELRRLMRASRRASGFTLVELLAVIAIIGILVGILIPALSSVRSNALRAQCQSNQTNVGAAMMQFALKKDRFPGQFETMGQQDLTWFGTLLSILGSETQADMVKKGNYGYVQYMSIAVCPVDSVDRNTAALSYAANTGVFNPVNNPQDTSANGLCHDLRTLGSKNYVTIQDVRDGQSQTIMLSENVNAAVWALPGGKTSQLKEGHVGITWPWDPNKWIGISFNMTNAPDTGLAEEFARPSSYHPRGGVNVAFADGHSIFMSPDISREVYGQLMSPNGARTSIPWNKNANLKFQLGTLTENMYTD